MEAVTEDIIRRARDGDREAFEVIVNHYAEELYRVALCWTGRTHDAEELVQDSLLGAFQGMSRFEGRSSIRTWLLRILSNTFRKRLRYQKLRKFLSLERMAEEGAPEPGLDQRAANDARIDAQGMLASLPQDQREVLVLRELEGLSYGEIAEVLGIPQGTVESRIFRARKALFERYGSSRSKDSQS